LSFIALLLTCSISECNRACAKDFASHIIFLLLYQHWSVNSLVSQFQLVRESNKLLKSQQQPWQATQWKLQALRSLAKFYASFLFQFIKSRGMGSLVYWLVEGAPSLLHWMWPGVSGAMPTALAAGRAQASTWYGIYSDLGSFLVLFYGIVKGSELKASSFTR